MSQTIDNSAALIEGLDRGETLPAHWYTAPDIAKLELRKLFAKTWAYVGPLNELKNVGDYITGYIGGRIPVAVVRGTSGLNGLINICRHRRHEVLKGRGNAQVLQCGYHAWTYNLAGCLQGAPRTAHEPGFRLEDYPLLTVRVETLGPWVFVNADRGAPPLREQYGKVLDVIAGSGIDLDSLVLHSRDEWESHSNWKTMLENYLECYHCAVAHPGFSAAIDVKPENYDLAVHGWFSSQVGMVRPSALEGRSQIKIYDARGDVAQAQYHLLFPNITININPGFPNLSIDIWWPNGPNGTRGFSEQYFGPGVSEDFAKDLIEFNRQVGREDDALTDSVQRGLLAGILDKGRYLTGAEHLMGHFQKLIVHMVSGDSSTAAATASIPPEGISRSVSVEPTASAELEEERSHYIPMEVARVEPESEIITSFYLRRTDGQPLHTWEPGQFLPIRVTIPGQDKPAARTYTISTACNPDHYRLSIRRGEGDALVSQYLHAEAKPGFKLEAMAPHGRFVLGKSDRPVVLVSGGVGITPMVAMAEHIVAESKRKGKFRPVYFVHGTQNRRVHAFREHIRALAADHPQFKVHISYSRPCEDDAWAAACGAGRKISVDTLKRLLPFGDFEFYLCGPSGFMRDIYGGLAGMGIPISRIFYESFGPATILKSETAAEIASRDTVAVPVRFARSAADADWSRDRGTLLEFAESLGIAPNFGCRSGICGTCTTRILGGAVDYLEEPVAPRGTGEVLLCCSVPRRGTEIILDL